jgi:hypothetical protein
MGLLPNNTTLKCLAPAAIQSLASFLIVSRRTLVGAALFLKTFAFCSFQIVQLTSIVIEANPLRLGDALQDMFSHHVSIKCW